MEDVGLVYWRYKECIQIGRCLYKELRIVSDRYCLYYLLKLIYMSQAGNWDMEKAMQFVGTGSGSKHLVGMLVDVQANHGISSAHVQCFSC